MLGPFWFFVIVLVPAAMVVLASVRRWQASGRLSPGGARALRVTIWLVVGALVVLPVTAGLIVGVANEGAHGVAAGAFAIGAIAAIVLVTRALIGDPSRGRRRCPRCWYDMSATPPPGLVCPECGKDAKRERRLLRTRRPRRMMGAGMLALLVGLMVYGGWLWRSGAWAGEAPTVVLMALSGWMDADNRGARALASRDCGPAELSSWERALGAWVSRGVIERGGKPGDGDDERRLLFHAQQLIEMREHDGATEDALIQGTRSADWWVARHSARLLGDVASSTEAEAALAKLTENLRPQVQEWVYYSLLQFKKRRPGGPAPASVLAAAADTSNLERLSEACELLGWYDVSEESRAALLAVNGFPAPYARLHAVASLVMLAPDEPAMRDLLVAYFKDDAMKGWHPSLIIQLINGDEAFTDARGELSARRRALYTDEVRAAMLEAMIAADPVTGGWLQAREVLREHPCLTEEERVRVP